ncbi:KPN_02809 family neutral zinc metallopeptidase [Halotalea alkalilenta]|uniref:KPN_02809 family neutral zinc metallopeptidase n=1 Tax=Halotalea alkalilenta TaxID=376489 RepID=UPI00047F8791|nr:neutral zinc metallopeptidase [Halotalea alkalilenta]
MKWDKGRRSDNVEDRRSAGSGRRLPIGGKGLSLGGVAIVLVVGMLLGQDPLQLLGQLVGQEGYEQSPPTQQQVDDPEQTQQIDFVRAILGDTEDTWQQLFDERGERYSDPRLVLFNGGVDSACGFASSAVGPFYCPGDDQVYLDLSFFDEMAQRFSAAGDFAQAYVIAHEVGHHVQNQLGISQRVQQLSQSGAPMEGANGLSVRQELQADCFAGVWANRAQARHAWLESGDVEEALNAASAIGDDRLQRETQGQVVPDAFTHGSSAQRVAWFQRGFSAGDIDQCDTFSADAI